MKKVFLLISVLLLQVNVFGTSSTSQSLDPFCKTVFSKFGDLLKNNVLCVDDITTVFNTLKKTGKVEDKCTAEKMSNVFEGIRKLYGTLQIYELSKSINCYSDIVLCKLRANGLIDENLIGKITQFKKVKDSIYEKKASEMINFSFQQLELLKKRMKAWPIAVALIGHLENLNDPETALFLLFKWKDPSRIKNVCEIKSSLFYEKLADSFVNDFFLRLEDHDKKILVDSFLRKKVNFFYSSDVPFEDGSLSYENLRAIHFLIYAYVGLCQQEFYHDGALDEFLQDSDSVFVRKIKEILESEMKKYPKVFVKEVEKYYRDVCSKNNISMECYMSILVEKSGREIDKLKAIILEKL